MRQRRKVNGSVFLGIALMVGACSSGSTTEPSVAPDLGAGPSQPTSISTPGGTAAPASDGPAAGGALGAVVNVAGHTYTFLPGPYGVCGYRDDGAITFSGGTSDFDPAVGGGASAAFLIQTDDWQDPHPDLANDGDPYINISDYVDGLHWNAGLGPFTGGVTYADSHIESSTLADGHAEGSALFVELQQTSGQEPPVSVPGTFEITCE